MNAKQQDAVIATYAAFRGAQLLPYEVEEFVREFKDATVALVERAIREVAKESGRVFLAPVIQRHAKLVAEARAQDLQKADEQARLSRRFGGAMALSPEESERCWREVYEEAALTSRFAAERLERKRTKKANHEGGIR